ncbi:MAG: PAS domain-containing protein [Bacteroidota bacterium]
MPVTPGKDSPEPLGFLKIVAAVPTIVNIHELAFVNSALGSIITIAGNGKIISVNAAACQLLGYSQNELLSRDRSAIFEIKEDSFKTILKQRTTEGHSIGLATAIKKTGELIPCEITSAVFMDDDGIEKAITTITDMRQSILKQKNADTKKEKIVADNIALAKSAQKDIDVEKEKIVADNIVLAATKQKKIDKEKEKKVADNIVLAETKQKKIDKRKEKIVADNIALVKSEQKDIDAEKEKVVADNIVLAASKQKKIDEIKEKEVADNIVLAERRQKKIDAGKEKIIAGDIILAQEKADARLADNNEWLKYIAKASYDVMWDWDIITGEVYVGDSIEEVFGFKVRNNIIDFKDLTEELFAGKDSKVQKKLLATISSGTRTWNDSYEIKRADGSVATVTSRASIVRDENGTAIRLIGATQDISMLQQLEKKLDEQITMHQEDSEKFLLAAKLSFDVIWDWNILTNQVTRGEGFEELFGYVPDSSGNTRDWLTHVHPDDKADVIQSLADVIASPATHWEQMYRFIRADNSIAKIFERASIMRAPDGKAYRMIGAMHDLSRQKELEEKLEQEITTKGELVSKYKENFKLILNSSSDILFDADLVTNTITISDAYEKEFGYKINNNIMMVTDWLRHIHPDDVKGVQENFRQMLVSGALEWKYSYRFLKADNSVANILSKRILLRNKEGKVYRLFGSMQDISKQVVLEEKLEKEIRLKEKQIADATSDAKEAERSDIGKELHDNVNQLLGVSRLYLEMAKRGGHDSEMYLSRSSEYTLTAIEEIRKLTKGLTADTIKDLGLCEAIGKIAKDTMQVNPLKIDCDLRSFMEDKVNYKFKLNIFRIVQEQLNNVLKHAKATEVRLSLVQTKSSIVLSISDNGIGFDTGKKQKGIGIANIKTRSASYNGVADFVSQPGKGCILTVIFPVLDLLVRKT